MNEVERIPIIKLYSCLIVSVQVALTDQLLSRLKDDITSKVVRSGATGLIIDLSGVDVMDSYISRAIRDLGLIAGMMGVSTVISGMKPMIATTLVEMDLDLLGVDSVLNLEDALELIEFGEDDLTSDETEDASESWV